MPLADAAFAEGTGQILSPGKQAALSRLREQELSLDKQNCAIQNILQQLDASFGPSAHTAPSTPQPQTETSTPRPQIDTQMRPQWSDTPSLAQMQRSARSLRDGAMEALLGDVTRLEEQRTDATDVTDVTGLGSSELQAQLLSMRTERANAAGRRASEQAQTLEMLQTVKERALLEARHSAAMQAAERHFARRGGWLLIRVLYNNLRSRNTLILGQIRWRFAALRNAFHRIARDARLHALSEPFEVERLRAGWRQFRTAMGAQSSAHLQAVGDDLRAADSLVRRKCGAVLLELGRLVRRKYLTGKVIDQAWAAAKCMGAMETLRAHAAGARRRVLEGRGWRQDALAGALLVWAALARHRGRRRRLGLRGRGRGRASLLGIYSGRLRGALEQLGRRGGEVQAQRREVRGAGAEHALHMGAWAMRLWVLHAGRVGEQCRAGRLGGRHRTNLGGLHARRVAVRALRAWRRHTQYLYSMHHLHHHHSRKQAQAMLIALRSWSQGTTKRLEARRSAHAAAVSLQLALGWARFQQQSARYLAIKVGGAVVGVRKSRIRAQWMRQALRALGSSAQRRGARRRGLRDREGLRLSKLAVFYLLTWRGFAKRSPVKRGALSARARRRLADCMGLLRAAAQRSQAHRRACRLGSGWGTSRLEGWALRHLKDFAECRAADARALALVRPSCARARGFLARWQDASAGGRQRRGELRGAAQVRCGVLLRWALAGLHGAVQQAEAETATVRRCRALLAPLRQRRVLVALGARLALKRDIAADPRE
ncbi:hypothetical protein B484DRAFT_405455, partial [Ochromonadaceae sp. CCMP2298]